MEEDVESLRRQVLMARKQKLLLKACKNASYTGDGDILSFKLSLVQRLSGIEVRAGVVL